MKSAWCGQVPAGVGLAQMAGDLLINGAPFRRGASVDMCSINDTLEKMRTASGAEKYFDGRKSDKDYARSYEESNRRISMFDEVIERLDRERRNLNLTKADLARRADLPAEAVRRLFSQQHKNPTLTTLIAIADALDSAITVTVSDSQKSGAAIAK